MVIDFDNVIRELKAGNDVTIRHVGTFYVGTIKARKIKSVVTGEIITIREKRLIRFRPAQQANSSVN